MDMRPIWSRQLFSWGSSSRRPDSVKLTIKTKPFKVTWSWVYASLSAFNVVCVCVLFWVRLLTDSAGVHWSLTECPAACPIPSLFEPRNTKVTHFPKPAVTLDSRNGQDRWPCRIDDLRDERNRLWWKWRTSKQIRSSVDWTTLWDRILTRTA